MNLNSHSPSFRMVDLIAKKQAGHVLSSEEIRWMVSGYTANRIPDYQMSAFLMTVYFQGMNREETRDLTRAMINSGSCVDLSSISGIKVDKHSTGGVGDKVSLVLAPLVAAAGVPVPMMAGRGLGHTGGTLDKLESIPGFRTDLSEEEFQDAIRQIGFAITGQTEKIAAADRKIYALRDATGTVASIPLISSSIISKKKAEGADALVLDVKVGRGALLQSQEEAFQLARELVALGNDLSLRTVALFTSMDEPLGYAVGNWLETKESIACLRGGGPSDLMEIVRVLGGIMLVLGKKAESIQKGSAIIQSCLESGEGLRLFKAMVKRQGGDLSFVENPEVYPVPKHAVTVESPQSGFISFIDARNVGTLSVALGAGRLRKEDSVDPGAGILFHKKCGDTIEKGDPLATFYTSKESVLEESRIRLLESFAFSQIPPPQSVRIKSLLDEKGELSLSV